MSLYFKVVDSNTDSPNPTTSCFQLQHEDRFAPVCYSDKSHSTSISSYFVQVGTFLHYCSKRVFYTLCRPRVCGYCVQSTFG